jgi:hypothetical protein
MNTNFDEMPLNNSQFDRLVDGELSERERRDLLARLDDESGGWRRCALAFLEAQCWKQTLGAMQKAGIRPAPAKAEQGRGTSRLETPTPGASSVRRRPRWTQQVATLAAMAACFFVAFWIGSAVHRSQLEPSDAPGQIAKTMVLKPAVVESPQTSQNLAGMATPRASAGQPWRMVTVSSPANSGGGAALRVPAVERNNIDERWAESMPPAVPEDVMRALNRSGHEIEQHREYVPVPLRDGRQLVMPVDQVKVRYVGSDTY